MNEYRLLNKVSKKNVFVLLTGFDFHSVYDEPPIEVAKIMCKFVFYLVLLGE